MNKFCLTALFCLLALSSVRADLEIHRVIPGKIIYRLNESGAVEITLANTGDQAGSAELKVSMVTDFDTRTPVATQAVSLEAGEEKTVSIPFDAGTERYGRAMLAELFVDGQRVAKRSEFFNVIDEWWRVAITGGGMSQDEKLRKEIFDYYHVPYRAHAHSWYPGYDWDEACGPFLGYGNHAMLFASMPSFFGEHTPDVPEDQDWYSGTGRYRLNTGKFKASVAACKRWGFKNSMFSIAAMTGSAGFELARQDPTRVARTHTGAFADAGYGSPDPVKLSKGITSPCEEWYGVFPDLYQERVVCWGAEELAAGVLAFDWDGVFFDGQGYVIGGGIGSVQDQYDHQGVYFPRNETSDRVSARNIRLTHEALRKAKPDLFIWYNGVNPASAETGGLEANVEMIAAPNSGSLYEIQCSQVDDPRNAYHNWRSLYESFLSRRDAVRVREWDRPVSDVLFNGAFWPEWFVYGMSKEDYAMTRSQWAWGNHLISLQAAAQFHPYVGGGSFRPMIQLMTRFSKFFWSENIHVMRKAYKDFEVNGLREVWWEDSVYTLDAPGHTDYILNLINAPEKETPEKTIHSDPSAAEDIQLSGLKWNSAEKLEAWAVVPYAYGDAVKEPSVYKLLPRVVGGEVNYELPPFRYYSLVVIREMK